MKTLSVAAFTAFVVLAAAPARSADPTPAPSADRAAFERERERVLERLRERGLPVPSASGAPARPLLLPAPSGSNALPPLPLPSGAALREELSRKWRALSESRLERRERHRAALVRELGQRLSDPQIKDELRLHATRVAELARIQFLTENGRTGAEREKLLERITKLSARETARHRSRMAALLGARALPSGSAAAPPTPSTAPSGGQP